MEEAVDTASFIPYIVVVNLSLVALLLVVLGRFLTRKPVTSGVPDDRQNLGEFILDFFVGRAREMGDERVVRVVAPFLATFFLIIFVSNLIGSIPIPKLNQPPTSYFSITLGLALTSVLGTLVMSAMFNGVGRSIKHLFTPNPMQWMSEITDVLSLSLRLFGNIGGEYMTLVLVASAVAYLIPLILHVLGFIPAFVQALVFTLLTASFISGAISHAGSHEKRRKRHAEQADASPQVAGEASE